MLARAEMLERRVEGGLVVRDTPTYTELSFDSPDSIVAGIYFTPEGNLLVKSFINYEESYLSEYGSNYELLWKRPINRQSALMHGSLRPDVGKAVHIERDSDGYVNYTIGGAVYNIPRGNEYLIKLSVAERPRSHRYNTNRAQVSAVDLDTAGERMVLGNDRGVIMIFDVTRGAAPELERHRFRNRCRRVWSETRDKHTEIVDRFSLNVITSLAFFPDGQGLLVAMEGRIFCLRPSANPDPQISTKEVVVLPKDLLTFTPRKFIFCPNRDLVIVDSGTESYFLAYKENLRLIGTTLPDNRVAYTEDPKYRKIPRKKLFKMWKEEQEFLKANPHDSYNVENKRVVDWAFSKGGEVAVAAVHYSVRILDLENAEAGQIPREIARLHFPQRVSAVA
ncbi:MAG: hypothetical protein Q7S79_00210, partial [bacterium]|nr:hypothetical protein [bacterium]